MNAIAIDPSPTADATRLMLPPRTSPTAKTPGRFVSNRYGDRANRHSPVVKSSGDKSGPVLMNPRPSSATHPSSQPVFGTAPVIMNTRLERRSREQPAPGVRLESTSMPADDPTSA